MTSVTSLCNNNPKLWRRHGPPRLFLEFVTLSKQCPFLCSPHQHAWVMSIAQRHIFLMLLILWPSLHSPWTTFRCVTCVWVLLGKYLWSRECLCSRCIWVHRTPAGKQWTLRGCWCHHATVRSCDNRSVISGYDFLEPRGDVVYGGPKETSIAALYCKPPW